MWTTTINMMIITCVVFLIAYIGQVLGASQKAMSFWTTITSVLFTGLLWSAVFALFGC